MNGFLLILVFVGVCTAQQASVSNPLVFNPNTPYTVPQQMFDFLEKFHWGDFHLVFHMTRKYYVVGAQGRQWIDSIGEKPAPYQEGDPNNGVEFLAMHRAMIEYLTQRFGSLPVTNDPDGRATMADVFRGWNSDSICASGLSKQGGDSSTFRAGLSNVNNFNQFTSEDEFGRFVQTAMRLQGTPNPNNPAQRHYSYDQRPGSGIHNWLHGQLQDDNSPITVGDPRSNLPNILFWRIHGWIESKWKQWEAARPRTADEDQLYQGFISEFRAHMLSMSEQTTLQSTTVSTTWSRASTKAPSSSTTSTSTETTDTTTETETETRTTRRRTTRRRTSAPLFDQFQSRSLQGVREDIAAADSRVAAQLQELDELLEQVVKNNHVSSVLDRVRRSIHRTHMAVRKYRVPWALVKHVQPRMFRNHVPECFHLSEGTTADNCPNGPRT